MFAKIKHKIMEYTISVHKDEASGWYCGQCVQVPAAISLGATLDELMDNMKDAISMILQYNKDKVRQSSGKVFYRKLALV